MAGTYIELSDLAAHPHEQFNRWYKDARRSALALPHAMTLATADAQGRPSARMVLLKDVDERGFVFYTNSQSRKGRELAQNPHAALVFHWEPLRKQVRIEGSVEPVPDGEADAYFATRPRGSQLGAWASPQSDSIADRQHLQDAVDRLSAQYPDRVPRPPHWTGFVVRPHTVEFWVDQASRLHDRFVYTRTATGWDISQLAP